MKVTITGEEFYKKISFQEADKIFEVLYGGNEDLYWVIKTRNESNYHDFIITKDNNEIYRLFEELFDDIENINIFDEIDPSLLRSVKDIEHEKTKYRYLNKSNYKELFDKDNNTITWYSDETNHDFANILKIKKEEDSFKLEFYLQPHVDGFDEDFTIPIRFCNSGSQYDPFNVIFMRMYNKMVNIDFNNDYEDQVSIKEYLESEKKVKKKTK